MNLYAWLNIVIDERDYWSECSVLHALCLSSAGPSYGNYNLGVDCDDEFGYDQESTNGTTGYLDSTYQVIKWSAYNQRDWATLKNENLKDL